MLHLTSKTNIEALAEEKIISVRTLNRLSQMPNLKTLGDIKDYGVSNLINVPGLGQKGIFEITRVLEAMAKDYGSALDAEDAGVYGDARQTLESLSSASFEEVLSQYEATIGDRLRDMYPDAKTLNEELQIFVSDGIRYNRFLSKDLNLEVRRFYQDYAEAMLSSMAVNGHSSHLFYSKLKAMREMLSTSRGFTIREIIDNFLSEEHDCYIQLKYEAMVDSLPARSKNEIKYKKRLKTYKDMMRFFENGEDKKVTAFGKDTRAKIKDFYYNILLPFIEDALQWDEEKVKMCKLEFKYPFLTEGQRQFALDFEVEYGHLPVFYILFHHVCTSDSNKIIKLYYGFSSQRMDMEEIAKEMELTRERVRQLIEERGIAIDREGSKRTIFLQELLGEQSMEPYSHLLSQPFLTQVSEPFLTISDQEGLNGNFPAFCAIVKKLCDKFYEFKFHQCKELVLVQKNRFPEKLKQAGVVLASLAARNSTKDISISYEELLGGVKPDKETIELIQYIAVSYFGLSADEKGVTAEKKKKDISDELYKILEENNRPMNLTELRACLVDKFPELSEKEDVSLRNYIRKNPNIRPQGNTSTYSLAPWCIYAGTIRDKAYDLLSKSPVPLRIDKLLEGVWEVFPDTNERSLSSNIMSDEAGRFVKVCERYYGLAINRERDKEFIKSTYFPEFKEKIEAFRRFAEEHKRYPRSCENQEESLLYQWLYRMTHKLDNPQLAHLKRVLEQYDSQSYPKTIAEENFQRSCKEYRQHVELHGARPSTGTPLHAWYMKAKREQDGYDNNRKTYFKQLCDYLEESDRKAGTSDYSLIY